MIFMNTEKDIDDCLQFYENLKMMVDKRVEQGIFRIVENGFSTLDHRKEMKKAATIKKQNLRDHRSLLS